MRNAAMIPTCITQASLPVSTDLCQATQLARSILALSGPPFPECTDVVDASSSDCWRIA